jgi:hypothetical protein
MRGDLLIVVAGSCFYLFFFEEYIFLYIKVELPLPFYNQMSYMGVGVGVELQTRGSPGGSGKKTRKKTTQNPACLLKKSTVIGALAICYSTV